MILKIKFSLEDNEKKFEGIQLFENDKLQKPIFYLERKSAISKIITTNAAFTSGMMNT